VRITRQSRAEREGAGPAGGRGSGRKRAAFAE